MALHVVENDSGNILELEVSGKLVTSDFHGLEATFQRLVRHDGKIRVLVRMRDFHGWEPAAFWDEIKFDLKHFGEIERLAIVGDQEWEKFLSVFGRPFTRAEIRYFDSNALAAARAWLEEAASAL